MSKIMTTIGPSTAIQSARPPRNDSLVNLILICVWSIAGLAFTGLSFALGFGVQVAQALAAG
jgi:hypothetical protein